jgi:hypothetical protein
MYWVKTMKSSRSLVSSTAVPLERCRKDQITTCGNGITDRRSAAKKRRM